MTASGTWRAALRAGVAYFAIAFGAGFVLGVLRVGWAVPRLGERPAELAEQPLMLVVIVVAARWLVRRFELPPRTAPRLLMGAAALALLVAFELTVVLALRGLTLAEYVATRDELSGAVYLGMLGLFAVMPLLVRRR